MAVIDDMVSILKSKDFNEPTKATAVYILGELKAVEAADTLIDLCNFSFFNFDENHILKNQIHLKHLLK